MLPHRINSRVPFDPLLRLSALACIFYRAQPSPLEGINWVAYGRAAFVHVLRLCGSPEAGPILLPAYICAELTEYIEAAGYRIIYHDVTWNLQPTVSDFQRKVAWRPLAVGMINYFGFPSDESFYQRERSEGSFFLISDEAQGALTVAHSSVADARIVSPRKLLAIPNGAGYFVHHPKLKQALADRGAEMCRRYESTWKFFVKAIASSWGIPLETLLRVRRRFSGNLGHEQMAGDCDISPAARWIAERLDLEEARAARRKIYSALLRELVRVPGILPLFQELPEEVGPMAFPVLCEDARSFVDAMAEAGIECHPWPRLPREVSGNPDFPISNELALRVVLLPCHPDVPVETVAEAVRRSVICAAKSDH